MCRPKEQGRIGFGKISLRNCALLGKWIWRFPREGDGLWHRVMASIYGTHPNEWDANTVVRWCYRCQWKAIAQGYNQFFQFTHLVVGNGERIRFWEDLWWCNQLLCAQYPDLYRVTSIRNLPILLVLGPSPPSTLNLQFRRNLTNLEINHLQGLLFFIASVHLSLSAVDLRSWSVSSTSLFIVKSFSLALSSSSNLTLFQPATCLWEAKGPLKVKAFAWLVAHRKVNTTALLQVRQPFKPLNTQWCVLCKGEGEAIDHLFLHCPYTIRL